MTTLALAFAALALGWIALSLATLGAPQDGVR